MPPLLPEVKRLLKRYAAPRLYPSPVSSLQPERLYTYLDVLWSTRAVRGAVVEIGCWLGGTAALAHRFLRNIGVEKRYICIDTFSGFVTEQFDHDRSHGTPEQHRYAYTANSKEIVRSLLNHYGCPDVELCQADIVSDTSEECLPDEISVALVDVDLDLPVYHSLKRVFPRASQGAVLLVDDCPEEYDWAGSRLAYQRFAREHGLAPTYRLGMGILRR